jgi:hypothetical protein
MFGKHLRRDRELPQYYRRDQYLGRRPKRGSILDMDVLGMILATIEWEKAVFLLWPWSRCHSSVIVFSLWKTYLFIRRIAFMSWEKRGWVVRLR